MKNVLTIVFAALAALTLTSGIAQADSIAPLWAGQAGSTHCEWNSWDGVTDLETSILPDVANAGSDAMMHGTAEHLTSYCGRDDVISLNGDWDLDFWMPVTNSDEQMIIYAQVTYLDTDCAGDVDLLLDVSPFTNSVYGAYLVDSSDNGDGWVTEAWEFIVEDDVTESYLSLNFTGDYPAYVDSVVIDTISVPEPATMCLLAAGSIMLMRRRRAA